MEPFTKYDKFLVACLGAVAQVVNDQYGQNKYVALALLLLTALGVYQRPNKA